MPLHPLHPRLTLVRQLKNHNDFMPGCVKRCDVTLFLDVLLEAVYHYSFRNHNFVFQTAYKYLCAAENKLKRTPLSC